MSYGGQAQADEVGDDDEPLLAELLHSLLSRRLRLALIRRLIVVSPREEPPGPVPKWLSRQERLDGRDEMIRAYRLAVLGPVDVS